MPPTVPVGLRISRPAGVPPRTHLADLCVEARTLASRRCRAEAASRRLRGPHAPRRAARLAACSDRLLVAFHRTLDRIWAADGFDEALAVFREYRSELGERLTRASSPPLGVGPPSGSRSPGPMAASR